MDFSRRDSESDLGSISSCSVDNEPSVEEIIDQMYLLSDCLPSSLIRSTENSKPSIVVAGSFALWLSLLERKNVPPRWFPNDMDIFVTGRKANREVKFEDVWEQFVGKVQLKGYSVRSITKKMNLYCISGKMVHIVDVKLDNFVIPFSFIRYQHVPHGPKVVDNFDINIVQVWLDLYSGELSAKDDVGHCIDNGTAVVHDVVWKNASPTLFEQNRLERTFARMRKFSERGFTFEAPPFIISEGERGS